MVHGKALAIKGVMTIVGLYLVLGIGYGVSFLGVLLLSIVQGALSYVAGDLFILPRFKNIMATFSDFCLTFLLVIASGSLFFSLEGSLWMAALIASVVIAAAEYGFHLYLATNVLPANNRVRAEVY
ncbi:DUF2512 family protein [Halobacillus massiliensis]|uniref:DUF2512 family protein n=1 Tax=Halobacillus massiliensis TaxID=1926286 RepID=UPI0009E3BF0C|nr:DUF2512 family protein [Halobacillus massiliensis]